MLPSSWPVGVVDKRQQAVVPDAAAGLEVAHPGGVRQVVLIIGAVLRLQTHTGRPRSSSPTAIRPLVQMERQLSCRGRSIMAGRVSAQRLVSDSGVCGRTLAPSSLAPSATKQSEMATRSSPSSLPGLLCSVQPAEHGGIISQAAHSRQRASLSGHRAVGECVSDRGATWRLLASSRHTWRSRTGPANEKAEHTTRPSSPLAGAFTNQACLAGQGVCVPAPSLPPCDRPTCRSSAACGSFQKLSAKSRWLRDAKVRPVPPSSSSGTSVTGIHIVTYGHPPPTMAQAGSRFSAVVTLARWLRHNSGRPCCSPRHWCRRAPC